ncbi:MAG: F0F1 ATP synthase subunit epsilon [Clostridiales bacterium]|nr:F0F1 ATP synthase subunit epsilon [Clostridiales bacterium]
MNNFRVRILATNKVYYEGECVSLVVPTTTGMIGIMAHRSNVICIIKPGIATISVSGEKKEKVYLGPGLLKVENGEVIMLVESAEDPDRLEEVRERARLEREEEIKLQKKSLREYRIAQAKLAQSVNKLKESNRERL